MDSAFDLLQTVCEQKEYKGFKFLDIGYHEIIKFRFVKNKFADSNGESNRTLLVELKDEVLFLPQYFADIFNDDDSKIEQLNNDGIKKFLYFGGARQNE